VKEKDKSANGVEWYMTGDSSLMKDKTLREVNAQIKEQPNLLRDEHNNCHEEIKGGDSIKEIRESMRKTKERKKWVIPKDNPSPFASINPEQNKEQPLDPNKDPIQSDPNNVEKKEGILNNEMNVQIIVPNEMPSVEIDEADMERDDLMSDSVSSTFSRADNQIQAVPISNFSNTDLTETLEQNITVDTTDIKIIKKLGGQVYLGKLGQTHSLVALKQFVINPDKKDAQQNIEVLANTVERIKNFEHPNIVKYLAFHRPDYNDIEKAIRYNIVIEYMEKGSLHDMLKYQSKGLAKSLIQNILRQVLTTLDFLHSHHILHRNVKSSNVLVDKRMTTFKVTDFELSTQVNNENPFVQREYAGTPWYMAPEVILGEPYSYSADIWSLGCLALELFTGKKPFDDSDGIKAMNQMVTNQTPLKMCSTEVRNALQYKDNATFLDFLNNCWKRDPTIRPSASTLLKHSFLKKSIAIKNPRPVTGNANSANRFKNTKNEQRVNTSRKQPTKAQGRK